jgi:hypothetical protein
MPRINEITITDTYGCAHFHVGPFQAVRLTGTNSTGKTSILRALAYLLEGGTDPTAIRKGAEKSTIFVGLDDGTKITKVTRPKKSRTGQFLGYTTDFDIDQPDGTPKDAPMTYVKELARSFDPSVLLRYDTRTAPGRAALVAALQTLITIKFSADEINAACSYRSSVDVSEPDTVALAVSPEEDIDLEGLKKAVASITEQRRRIGGQRDDADGAYNRLSKSLPAQDGKDHRKAVQEAEDYRRAVEKAMADATRVIDQKSADEKLAATSARAKAESAAEAKYQEAVRAARNARDAEMHDADRACNEALMASSKAHSEAVAAIEEESRPELNKAIENVAAANAALESQIRATSLKGEIERNKQVFLNASFTYDRLSEVLQRLETLRMKKLSDLPVTGFSWQDGVPCLDGIEWYNVNLGRIMTAIMEICAANCGKMPFVMFDDAEHLSDENRREIEEGLTNAGFQWIGAVMVSDKHRLTIEVIPPTPPASTSAQGEAS